MNSTFRLLALFLGLVGAAVLPLSALAGDKKKSSDRPGTTPVTVRVFNFTGQPLEMISINSNGISQSIGTLPPLSDDGPSIIHSAKGYQWEFRVRGLVMKKYVVSGEPNQELRIGSAQTVLNSWPVSRHEINGLSPLVKTRGALNARPSLEPFWTDSTGATTNFETAIPPNPDGEVSAQPSTGSPKIANGESLATQEFLKVHNAARAEVRARPLRWSAALARRAQQWAEHLAASGQLQHRPQDGLVVCGENLFGGPGDYSPSDAARAWLEERHAYPGGPFSAMMSGSAGHYTQMVWKNTREVGYGMATGPRGVVIVSNYFPPGNFLGVSPY